MKSDWSHLEQFRKRNTGSPYDTDEGEKQGAFYIHRAGTLIICIASCGNDEIPWEHVSCRVSSHRGDRIPTWEEMCFVKAQFWDDEECVVQFHPPKSEYINNHPCVLHLWRCTNAEQPMPPSIAVGIK